MDDQAFLEELKKDFFDEATNLIQLSEDNILILEKDPANMEAVNEIFRVFHTIKGGAASLELDRIAAFTHEVENLLDDIRRGVIKMGDDIFDTLLNSIDLIKNFMALAQDEKEPDEGLEKETTAKIIKLLKSGGETSQAPTVTQASSTSNASQKGKTGITKKEINYSLTEYDKEFISKSQKENENVFDIYIKLNSENPMKTVSGLQIYSILKEFGSVIKSYPDIDDLLDDQFSEDLGFVFATDKDSDFVESKVFISDVTDYINISQMALDSSMSEAESVAGSDSSELELNATEQNEIIDYISKGNNAYKLTVTFDDSNPMRSVSGVLFFSMLQGLGNIIKSAPSLEEFKQDIFYKTGIFILISVHDTEYLKQKLYISDITKELKIYRFKEKGQSDALKDQDVFQSAVEQKTPSVKTEVGTQTSQGFGFTNSDTPQKEVALKNEPPTPALTSDDDSANQQSSTLKNPSAVTKSSILRVESKRVDDLLNLVGELVISKASFFQVLESVSMYSDDYIQSMYSLRKDIKSIDTFLSSEDIDLTSEEGNQKIREMFLSLSGSFEKLSPRLKKFEEQLITTTQSFGRLTNELHESVMKLRMVPINQIFNRFPRLVRDLSKTLNKKINLVTHGEDTELDKSLIEDLIDPLIHIVRNAVDHGIEAPEEREAKGKSKEGTLILEADHEGQMISIRIKDDGAGLNKDRIKKKARDLGLIDEKKELTEDEINNLIFQPGFSTTESISQVSGRGVGMDVVRQKVDSLNGTISIETVLGRGTTFIIKLPLTLAIIQALMVEVADLTYSIPINSVIETIRIAPNEIEMLENNEIIRVRDEVMSLIHLKEAFNHGQRDAGEHYYVIIVGTSENKIGLVVDSLIGEQDVVIKPLNSKFAASEGIAGAAILGDGRVSLIIDIPQLIKTIKQRRR